MNKSIIKQEESKRRFKIGSQYFFGCYDDFNPSDIDEVEFEENPELYKNYMQFRKKDSSRCLFKWRKMSADEFVDYTLNTRLPMEIGKFLVPEVNQYLGFTIEHLKKLSPIAEKLDDRHKYEKVIFDSYLKNNEFLLSEEQRQLAYQEYKKERL